MVCERLPMSKTTVFVTVNIRGWLSLALAGQSCTARSASYYNIWIISTFIRFTAFRCPSALTKTVVIVGGEKGHQANEKRSE